MPDMATHRDPKEPEPQQETTGGSNLDGGSRVSLGRRLTSRANPPAADPSTAAMSPIRWAASDGTSEMRIATVHQVAAIADQGHPDTAR